MSVNRATLHGRVGADPEVRHLEGGATVANFNLATSEKYKDKNGKTVENTEWHRITAWGYLAEFAESHIQKGMGLFIEGSIKTRKWQDKDGNDRYTTEIQAYKIDVTDWNRPEAKAQEQDIVVQTVEAEEETDLPF